MGLDAEMFVVPVLSMADDGVVGVSVLVSLGIATRG